MMGRMMDGLYRFLLGAFPPRYRDRYGAEMVDTFRRERRRAFADKGVVGGMAYLMAANVDVVRSGLRERRTMATRRAPQRVDGAATGVWKDVRSAVRNLVRSWTFTLVCLTSLAIGLGINLAISTLLLVNLAAHPAIDEDGALEILMMTQGRTLGERWTYPDFEDVRNADTGMQVTAWVTGMRNLRTDDGADDERARVMFTSTNYFETLGIDVAPGRPFLSEEDRPVGEPPVIISHDMWLNRLGADPAVLGRSLILNNAVHTVVGVAPEGYGGACRRAARGRMDSAVGAPSSHPGQPLSLRSVRRLAPTAWTGRSRRHGGAGERRPRGGHERSRRGVPRHKPRAGRPHGTVCEAGSW